MIRQFFNFSDNYFKRKIFKIILFILLLLGFYFVGKIKSHAAVITGNGQIYVNTLTCDLENNNFACRQRKTFKYNYNLSSSNNTNPNFDIDKDIFDINSGATDFVLVNQMIFNYTFDNDITIDNSNNKTLQIKFGNPNGFQTAGTGSTNLQMVMDYFPNSTYYGGSDLDRRFGTPNTYNFKPYLCTYVDKLDNSVKVCDIKLSIAANDNVFAFVPVIPVGTTFNNLKLYIGSPTNFNGAAKTVALSGDKSNFLPNDSHYLYNNVNLTSSSTYFNYYNIYYNNYRQVYRYDTPVATSDTGLFMYSAAATLSEDATFKIPNYEYEVETSSSSVSSNIYGFSYSSYTDAQLQSYKSQYDELEQNIQDQEQDDNWFVNSMDDFINNETTNSFINLFNSLFTYPFYKLNQQLDYGLTYTNINGTPSLSPAICKGVGIGGDFGPGLKLSWHGAEFNFPCVHYDIYSKMYNDNYGFYPTTLNGAAIVGGRSSNFYSIYRLVFRGVLVYALFITCLDIYKYILDSDRKEIEVLEL